MSDYLALLAGRYQQLRGETDAALAELLAEVRAEHAAGVTEYRLWKTTGLPRGTIRRAIGKETP